MTGIRTFCKHKQELYTARRNNPELKNNYERYCKALSTVIKEVKRLEYDSKIKKFNNQNKAIWHIVKTETGQKNTKTNDKIDKLIF
jgi:hypothetical protein